MYTNAMGDAFLVNQNQVISIFSQDTIEVFSIGQGLKKAIRVIFS